MPFPLLMVIQHYSPSTGYRVQSASIITYTKGICTQIQTIKHYRLISLACQTPGDIPQYSVEAVLPATLQEFHRHDSNQFGLPTNHVLQFRTRGEG